MTIKQLFNEIRGDLGKSGSISKFIKSYLYNARFRVLLNHRIGKFCYNSNNYFLRQIAFRYKYILISRRGCDISYHAVLGKNIKFPHPIGIVIGDGVIIGDNVTIFQQVTFGSHGKSELDYEYPIVEEDVKIFAGAKIVGGIKIQKGSIVGANSFVNKNIPPNSIAYGIPCTIKGNQK